MKLGEKLDDTQRSLVKILVGFLGSSSCNSQAAGASMVWSLSWGIGQSVNPPASAPRVPSPTFDLPSILKTIKKIEVYKKWI